MLTKQIAPLRFHPLTAALTLLCLTTGTGCTCIATKYPVVPASRLDRSLWCGLKAGKTDIPFSALGQALPETRPIGPGDRLSIYIYGVFPPALAETPVVERQQSVNQRYYPPNGNIIAPAPGLPVEVDADGTIQMPLIGHMEVVGLTVRELSDKLRDAFQKQGILVGEGRDRIMVTLLMTEVERIIVVRQDTPAQPAALVPPGQVEQIHRGSGEVIDLPTYENDVLHALAATGGLPGTDAANEVWIIRRRGLGGMSPDADSLSKLTAGFYTDECNPGVIRIPLKGYPGDPLPFKPEDVILESGDVVYVPRYEEYFYTGGLLRGARIPLPRDQDIDVLEAVALANGSVNGPLGQSGQVLASGQTGNLIRPSVLIVLRKLPDGEQLPIEVDMNQAVLDPKERIMVQNGDMLMMRFRRHEAILSGIINFIHPNFLIRL